MRAAKKGSSGNNSEQPHLLLDLGDGRRGDGAGASGAVREHVPHVIRSRSQVGAPLAKSGEGIVDPVREQVLAVHAADAGSTTGAIDLWDAGRIEELVQAEDVAHFG